MRGKRPKSLLISPRPKADELVLEAAPQAVLKVLQARKEELVAVIGHEPWREWEDEERARSSTS